MRRCALLAALALLSACARRATAEGYERLAGLIEA
jgi:hypothetical protein